MLAFIGIRRLVIQIWAIEEDDLILLSGLVANCIWLRIAREAFLFNALCLGMVVDHEPCSPVRCRANVARVRHSRPDSGRSFQAAVPKKMKLFPLYLETDSVHKQERLVSVRPAPQT